MEIAVESREPSSPIASFDKPESLSPVAPRAQRSQLTIAGMFSALYDELRRIGRSMLRLEHRGHLLEPCALVNEAYLRLHQTTTPVRDRAHGLRLVAQVMRRILIDHGRLRQCEKNERPCPAELANLQLEIYVDQTPADILDIDCALAALAERNETAACMIQLHWYFGVDPVELEALCGVSEAGVTRSLRYARKWLAEFSATHQQQALAVDEREEWELEEELA